MTEQGRTLRDYHPRHDYDCGWYRCAHCEHPSHLGGCIYSVAVDNGAHSCPCVSMVRRPCTCGLAALLTPGRADEGATTETVIECDQCGLKQSEWELPLVVGASCPRHYLDDDSCDGIIHAAVRQGPPPETVEQEGVEYAPVIEGMQAYFCDCLPAGADGRPSDEEGAKYKCRAVMLVEDVRQLIAAALREVDASELLNIIRAHQEQTKPVCGARPNHLGFICTLDPGHAGDHDASGCHTWPNQPNAGGAPAAEGSSTT